MDPVESRQILLKGAHKNRRQAELLQFVEAMALHLEVGYDLAFSWEESALALRAQSSELYAELHSKESLSARLNYLAEHSSLTEARVWFSLLLTLYQEGSPILGAVNAFRRQLNVDIEAALIRHHEEFPVKASLVLLFFFLPPAFCLIFYPLLQQWARAIN